LHRMDLMGISISTGAACNSVDTEISHVLRTIQVDDIVATTVSRREILRGDGCNIAFTAKGSTLYAIADSDKPGEILIEGLSGQPLFLSDHSGITWRQEEEGMRIIFESACEMRVTMKFANGEP